jgi:hypothetical protein
VLAAATFLEVAREDRRHDVDRAFALLLVASVLLSPLGWIYYVWFALPPLAALCARGIPAVRFRLQWIVILGFAWPIGMAAPGGPAVLRAFTFGSVYFWALLGTWDYARQSMNAPELWPSWSVPRLNSRENQLPGG